MREALDLSNIPELTVVPEPWKHNPSSWNQRVRVCLVAAPAVLISAYLALYQLGFTQSVWDPVFGDQSSKVIGSDISHRMTAWFRVPDALLGCLAYLGDIIFALAGSVRRWQFRPWLVVLFGLDVIPLGIVSALLVFIQGAVLGLWCTLCIVTALISLSLVVLAYDEVWSCLIYLGRVYKRSKSLALLWRTFCGYPSELAHEVSQDIVRRKS